MLEVFGNELYDINEVADIIGVHPKTVLRFIKEGKINSRKVGRSYMMSQEDIEGYTKTKGRKESK